jgi:FAD/FMN-containing dehydrogenase/Fe-S oxidoreductase
MFGPETSTASRAMVGGMVGNNSCGLHSIVWGSVRDHLLEATVVLSDGSETVLQAEEIGQAENAGFKGRIYRELLQMLSNKHNQHLIRSAFPNVSVVRRNTGYALDSLINMQPFAENGTPFNLCSLLAGSEGTLAIVTEVKLALLPLPPKETAVVCIHCSSIDEALRGNIVALKHHPMASELVDKYITDFTIGHPEYDKNRYFIEGDPAAILMVEYMAEDRTLLNDQVNQLIACLQSKNIGYAYPVLYNEQTKFAWDIRKAGLGLLRNLKGDAQPVNLIEDCAVAPEHLPDYIRELQEILAKYQVAASYYAHAGAGEIHVEPIINLRSPKGLATFRSILTETAALVKKYNGSLSGEHGDGRLRGEFIPFMVGDATYELFKQTKKIFDPKGIFNAGKITDTPPMDTGLRISDNPSPDLKTTFDFSAQDGILRLAEKCSGSGDCRRTEISGGLMCPSYMATRREKDTTRARANVLRQFLSNPEDMNPFNHDEIKEVMDLCLSCKGCKIDCPSSVDITKMKAEFLQHYYEKNGTPFRSRIIGNFTGQMKLASRVPALYNLVFGTAALRKMANRLVGFHPSRSMPLLPAHTLRSWFKNHPSKDTGKKVYLFCDEFTNYLDVGIGEKAILLLQALGYEVIIPDHRESGRSYLSKGLVKKAAEIANDNVEKLWLQVDANSPLIGIEPSAILTLRDEYIDLATPGQKAKAKSLAGHTYTIEEFLSKEIHAKHIHPAYFTDRHQEVVIHGHCYQKVLSVQENIKTVLSLPLNYKVKILPTGCCGMAGAFGYEAEHYDVSMAVGELVLFPSVRKLGADTIVAASGTSCRHQIKDGTQRRALHPVEILYDALLKPGV